MALGIIGLLGSPERGRRVESWIEQIVADIREVEGVKGVFLLNQAGEIVFPPTPPEHPVAQLLADAARDIIQTLAIFELTGNSVQELKLNYSDGALLIYDRFGLQVKTPQGPEAVFLVVLCGKDVNRPHLRMVTKVAMTKAQDRQKNARTRPAALRGRQASLVRSQVEPSLHKLLDSVLGIEDERPAGNPPSSKQN